MFPIRDPDGSTSGGPSGDDSPPGGTGNTSDGGSDTFAAPNQDGDGDGCGCRSQGGTSGWAWSLLLGLVAIRRRRSRTLA